MSVSICGKNLKNSIINCQNTDIKGTTAKIKDKNVLLTTLLVQTICDGGCGWFIDNPSNIQPSNYTGILSCLSLGVIEVCCVLNRKTMSGA